MKDTPGQFGMFGALLFGGGAWIWGANVPILAALPDQIASVLFHSYLLGLTVCLTPPSLAGFYLAYGWARRAEVSAAIAAKRQGDDLAERVEAADAKRSGAKAEQRTPATLAGAFAKQDEEPAGLWELIKVLFWPAAAAACVFAVIEFYIHFIK